MEEALEILWTYARRQPIESNGKTVVASISQSIAAIRIIMRLERWLQKSEGRESEERKMMGEEPEIKPSKNLELGYEEEKNRVCEPFAQPQLAHANESLQLVPTNNRVCSASILTEDITFDQYELQAHASERVTKSASTYLVAASPSERGLGERISAQRGFGERICLPYHEVLAHFASSKAIKSRKPYRMSLRAQVAGLSIRTACKQKKQRRNAACKAKERKSAYNPKNFIVAAPMYDRNRIRPPCYLL